MRFFDETYPGAFLDLGPDTTLCESDSISLEAIAPGATEFLWDDGSTAPFLPVTQSGTYSATVFFEHCPLFDEVEIMLIDCRGKIYIPNAFSPNNDGFNDEFKPYGKDVLLKKLKIFDRWGGLLFETNQPELGWDGTRAGQPAIAGVYVYLLEYVDAFNGQKELESGEVHLIR